MMGPPWAGRIFFFIRIFFNNFFSPVLKEMEVLRAELFTLSAKGS